MENHVAWIDDVHVVTVSGNNIELLLQDDKKPAIHWETKGTTFQVKLDKKIDAVTAKLALYEELPMGESLMLLWGGKKIPVFPRAIVRTDWFDRHYSAKDSVLGADCDQSGTTFSIWAPTATSVKLSLNNLLLSLNRQEKGVWEIRVNGEWHGTSYNYQIEVNGNTTIVNDPYAKGMLANSEKGVVIDFARTEQSEITRPQLGNLQDAIIYEMHVRDATIHGESGVINKGKYSGLAEMNTVTENGYSTALSYIKELGCTHVQILPINDFARVNELHPEEDYNWGYDPLYFQVPEGSYSNSPGNPLARINECKNMIHTFHREGISVILDVVFNHVFIMEESPFEKAVPGYYFRYNNDGSLSNGTGVGNDIATEKIMARKFILDTIDFWLKEYNVDGFRFDLMGSMDIDTMNCIHERCQQEEVPVLLLGEGWNLPTALAPDQKAASFNSQRLPGIRFFNDYFRDSLKGNLFDVNDTGFVNGYGRFIERMPNLISGSTLDAFGDPFVSEVNQTVNYVECHDNHTLWDRLLLTNSKDNESDRKKIHQLATGITLLSQGVPFIHAGQEWFRSKQGDENSYNSGDRINQLDWNKRETEDENIEFIKRLITLRKKHNVFRLASKQEIKRRFHVLDTPNPTFGFTLLGDSEDFSIYVNPTKKQHQLQLSSPGSWQVAVTNDSKRKQQQQEVNGEFTVLKPYELIVLMKAR